MLIWILLNYHQNVFYKQYMESSPFYQLYIGFQCFKNVVNLMDENLYLNVICTSFLFGMSLALCVFSLTHLSFFYCQPTRPSSFLSSLHCFLPPSCLPSIYTYKWVEIQHCLYFVAQITLSLVIGRVERAIRI